MFLSLHAERGYHARQHTTTQRPQIVPRVAPTTTPSQHGFFPICSLAANSTLSNSCGSSTTELSKVSLLSFSTNLVLLFLHNSLLLHLALRCFPDNNTILHTFFGRILCFLSLRTRLHHHVTLKSKVFDVFQQQNEFKFLWTQTSRDSCAHKQRSISSAHKTKKHFSWRCHPQR